jgi:hypothetical protein
MKLHKMAFLLMAFLITALPSCDYTDLDVDPNRPTSAPPSLILNGVLLNMRSSAWNTTMRWNQYYCINYNYYGNNEYWSGAASLDYTRLKDVLKMEEEAARSGAPAVNPYAALGKFLRAFYFVNMSLKVGDIPLSEALNGLENTTPKYATQKEVFVQSLKWLEEANTDLAALIQKGGQRADGDWFFGGDLLKWQKTVNAFRLRVLVHLSKKESDADLQVKQQFAAILGNPTKYPLMGSIGDNLQFISKLPLYKYPKNPDNYGFDALRENTSKLYIDLLKGFKDPRLFVVAEPAEAKLKTGISPLSHDAFQGASSGESLDDMTFNTQKGEYSLINRKRFYATYEGEPIVQIGYPEMCFNIAEGIQRGWASGNAEDWYNKGIQASMEFYGIKTGNLTVSFAKAGAVLGVFDTYTLPVDVNAYLAQPSVKYAGNTAAGLEQILKQKYLALAQSSDLEAYYNYRRTGIPAFLTGVGTGNGGRIPQRFQYPANERTTNTANLTEALQRQYGGNDDVFGKMWMLQ